MDKILESQIQPCKNIDIISLNMVNLSLLYNQYPNIEAEKTWTCLISAALNNFTGSKENITEKLTDFFSKHPQVLENITVKHFNNINEFYNHAVAGIVYLNQLRVVTPGFKYIYYADIKSQVVIQENKANMSLGTALRNIKPDIVGKEQAKSLLLQLLIAVNHAHQIGVSNFPFVIECKIVDVNSLLPIYRDKSIEYLKTFGYIAIFSSYTTCAILSNNLNNGSPITLETEINNIYTNFINVMKETNPDLADMFEPTQSQVDYSNIILISANPENVISCLNGSNIASCYTLQDFIGTLTYSAKHGDILITSYLNRIDELLSQINLSNSFQTFITLLCVKGYLELINDLKKNMSEQTMNEVFKPSRYTNNVKHSKERLLNANTLISDNDFIKKVSNINFNGSINKQQFNNFINLVIKKGNEMNPQFYDLENSSIYTLINTYLVNLQMISYFKTSNVILGEYSKIYNEPTQNFKDKLEKALSYNNQIHSYFVNNKIQVNDRQMLLYYIIYQNFFGLDDKNFDLLKDMILQYSDENIDKIKNIYHNKTILASDPMLLI